MTDDTKIMLWFFVVLWAICWVAWIIGGLYEQA